MPRLYVDGSPKRLAYVLDGGGSGYQELRQEVTSMEAEYLSIIYGLNEYFLKWNKELDERASDIDREHSMRVNETIFADIASPSGQTKRPLPPPVLVLNDNETVVMQLNRLYHIGNPKLRKLAQQVWSMTENIQVKFEWISRRKNPAGKMLK